MKDICPKQKADISVLNYTKMNEQFYNRGRSDALRKLPANPCSATPDEYNHYMNGYNSVQQEDSRDVPDSLVKIIGSFQKIMKSHEKGLLAEVDQFISSGCKDSNKIALMLDYYIGFVDAGFGEVPARKLLEYYAAIDKKGAKYYQKEIFGKKKSKD